MAPASIRRVTSALIVSFVELAGIFGSRLSTSPKELSQANWKSSMCSRSKPRTALAFPLETSAASSKTPFAGSFVFHSQGLPDCR